MPLDMLARRLGMPLREWNALVWSYQVDKLTRDLLVPGLSFQVSFRPQGLSEEEIDEEAGEDELFALMTQPALCENGRDVPDEHQAAAIVTSARYALLVSGAGTGKTRVLGARMAHLIASKAAKPSQVGGRPSVT
jgi:hypothetical protein